MTNTADLNTSYGAIEAIAYTYGPRISAMLQSFADHVESPLFGLEAGPVRDMHGDEFIWSVLIFPYHGNQEDGVDVTLTVVDQAFIEGEDPDSDIFGVTFSLDIHGWGGRLVGGLQPYNFTEDWVVDARDPEAVERRFRLIEDNADPVDVVDLVNNWIIDRACEREAV